MPKLHKDFEKLIDGGGQRLAPQGRLARAYAEGYTARCADKLQSDNPHGAGWAENTSGHAWDQGWRDADAGYPSTHVGVAPPAPETPEGEEPSGEERTYSQIF